MTYDLRSLQRFKHLCSAGCFVLGSVYSFQVGAAVTAPDTAFNAFYSLVTAPGKQTVSFGTNGTPVVAPGVPSVASAGGQPYVTRTGSLPLGGGARLPITATAKIPNSAIASIVKKALPYARTATNPLALALLAVELGFNLTTSDTAEPVVNRPDPNVCSFAPCYEYKITNQASGRESPYLKSLGEVCSWYAANFGASAAVMTSCVMYKSVNMVTAVPYAKSSYGAGDLAVARSTAPLPPASVVVSSQEFADAIAAKSGWPSGSAVSQAVVDASRVTGEPISTDQPTVTGPASVPGPVEVATTPYGDQVKKSTKSTNYDCTYVQGATVMDGGQAICTAKTTVVDEVTATDPVTGAKTTTTTTASEASKPAEITPDDKPAEDPCIKNPNRNGCRTDELDVPTGEIPKTSKTITYAAENLGFAGGSCPANRTLTAHGMSAPITVINWVDNCDKLTTYAKPMILALAMFSAMMIIFVGKPE